MLEQARKRALPRSCIGTRLFALLTVRPARWPPRRHGHLPSSPAPCAVLNSGAHAREASGDTIVTFRVYEGVFVPPSRQLRRFYGVDPPMQAFSTRFYCRVCANLAQIGPNLRARCAPTDVKRCFCAPPRLEAHKYMHIRVCTASCRARRSKSRGGGRDERAGLKDRELSCWR